MQKKMWKQTLLGLTATTTLALGGTAQAAVFINEFHYDNTGSDEGEFVEIVTTNSEVAADITLTLYNGNNSESYDTHTLDTFTDHGIRSDGNRYFSKLISGIQNGAPDGLAIDLSDSLIEFLSYEGTFTASGGPADSILSTDIGASQSSSAAVGSSLQRIAFGSTWVSTDGSNTLGNVNIPEPASLALLGLGGLMMLGRRRSA